MSSNFCVKFAFQIKIRVATKIILTNCNMSPTISNTAYETTVYSQATRFQD